jgi:hypothetical protein
MIHAKTSFAAFGGRVRPPGTVYARHLDLRSTQLTGGGAGWEQRPGPYRAQQHPTALYGSVLHRCVLRVLKRRWSGRCPRFVDTEEVTGSNPVSPTREPAGHRLVTEISVTSRFVLAAYIGSKLGAQDRLRRSGGRGPCGLGWVAASANVVGADNLIQAGQAACLYSCRTPPRRSCRRMLRWAMVSGSVIDSRSGCIGRALLIPRWGRWVL